jgi:hypothetical protein
MGLPKLGGYRAGQYADVSTPGVLEGICYRGPDTAKYQRVWKRISLAHAGETVEVEATGLQMNDSGVSSFGFRTVFRLDGDQAFVVSNLPFDPK